MKRLLIVALALWAGSMHAQTKNESPFELKDVYIQVDIHKPHLVTNEPIPKQYASLGENVRLWVTVQLRPGAKSPCASRDEEQCYIEQRIAAKDAERSGLKYLDTETRINTAIEWSSLYPIRRDSSLGEKVFLFRVRYKDQILNTFEFSLEVTE